MLTILNKVVTRVARDIAIRSGWAGRRFARQQGRFRVLTYHGLVPDALADRAWVPSHFVTVSHFERQMAMLADLPPGTVRPLGQIVRTVRAGDRQTAPAVCITFDDGTADNVSLALPILARYGFPATFFLTTGCVGTDELLTNDRIRLLRRLQRADRLKGQLDPVCARLLTEPGANKAMGRSTYSSSLDRLWILNLPNVDPDALAALRMMSWDQARVLHRAGMEIGAHTVQHVILANEDAATRQGEITQAVTAIRNSIGQQEVPFCYPNGQPADYGPVDLDILGTLPVPYAVTGVPGWNDRATPHLELRRNCIGRHGSDQAFLASVFGFPEPPAERTVDQGSGAKAPLAAVEQQQSRHAPSGEYALE